MQQQKISGRSRVLAVIADPVAQARSPGMANELLHEWGEFGNFVLIPLNVHAEGLSNALQGIREIKNFDGAIVSMPHKRTIVTLLDKSTREAQLAGAVNVIRRCPSGRLVGDVLDGEGMVRGLLSAGHSVRASACLLVGAGGAASAIAIALAKHGCKSLRIVNRTSATAAALADRVRSAFPSVNVHVGPSDTESYDIAINATSLGMRPTDPLPISPDIVERCAIVAECVIAPEVTPLLELARHTGRVIHTGVPMLASQMELMLRFMIEPMYDVADEAPEHESRSALAGADGLSGDL